MNYKQYAFALILAVMTAFFYVLLPHLDSMTNDPGLGWHLKSGQLMIESQSFIYAEPFLAYPEIEYWVHDQWLSDVLLFCLYQIGDWPLLCTVVLSLFLLMFFPLVMRRSYLESGTVIFSAIASLISLKLVTLHVVVRPVALSLFLLAVFLSMLTVLSKALRDGRSPGIGQYISWALLFLLWANIHPYFALGLLIFGATLLGLLIDQYVLNRAGPSLVVWRHGCALFGLCILVTLINPYGYYLHLQVVSQGMDSFFSLLYSEWASVDFTRPEGKLLEFVLGMILLAALFSKPFRSRYGFAQMLPFLGLLHFALGSIRGVPILAIYVVPLLASAFYHLLTLDWFYRFRFWPAKSRPTSYSHKSPSGMFPALILSVLLCIGAHIGYFKPVYGHGFGPDRESFPWEVMPVLNQLGMEREISVYTSLNLGGFITFFGYPEVRPVLDDRNTLHSRTAFEEFLRLQSCKISLCDVELAKRSDVVLFPSDSCVWLLMPTPLFEEDRVVQVGNWKLLTELSEVCNAQLRTKKY